MSKNLKNLVFSWFSTRFDRCSSNYVDWISTLSTLSTKNSVDNPAYFFLEPDVLRYRQERMRSYGRDLQIWSGGHPGGK